MFQSLGPQSDSDSWSINQSSNCGCRAISKPNHCQHYAKKNDFVNAFIEVDAQIYLAKFVDFYVKR